MIRKMVYVFIFLLSICVFSTAAQTRNVLFLGIFNQKGEHVEPLLEQAIRNELSAGSEFRLIGETETLRHLREVNALGATPLERFVPPKSRIDTSAIVIWGLVKESSIRPGRRMLLWGRANAVLTVEFFIGEFKSGAFYYRGELTAHASKGKGFLHLGSPQKKVHISVTDRSELKNELQSKMVKEISDIFNLVLNALADASDSENARESDLQNETSPEEYRIPSVADIFAEPVPDAIENAAENETRQEASEPRNPERTEPRREEPDGGMEATVTVE